MEHQKQRHNEQAALYAEIIVGWHVRMGVDQWRRQRGDHKRPERDEGFERYVRLVARFHESDLTDPAIQLELANEQLAGSMEWAYMMNVDEEVQEVSSDSRYLGAIARKLRELASQPRFRQKAADGGRRVVRFSDHEDLLAQAKDVYGNIAGPEVQGGGGTSFLLSCSLERAGGDTDDEVVLLSPEILGILPAPRGREADLLEQLASETLEILDVTGS